MHATPEVELPRGSSVLTISTSSVLLPMLLDNISPLTGIVMFLFQEEKRYLLVVGVKRGQHFSEIEKVINREKTMGAPLSEEEICKGLVFKDYYILTCPGSMKGVSDHQQFDGESGQSYLTLRLHRPLGA